MGDDLTIRHAPTWFDACQPVPGHPVQCRCHTEAGNRRCPHRAICQHDLCEACHEHLKSPYGYYVIDHST